MIYATTYFYLFFTYLYFYLSLFTLSCFVVSGIVAAVEEPSLKELYSYVLVQLDLIKVILILILRQPQ